MPTPTYTPLANVTLGASATSVTFSSIPSTYRDLIVVFEGTATASPSSLRAQVNSDTASNYTFVRAGGTGSATFSSSSTIGYVPMIEANQQLGATRSNSILQVMDYSATDKHKTFLVRENNNNSSGPSVVMYSSRWANTAAVTELRVFVGANSMASGTTLALYGIAS